MNTFTPERTIICHTIEFHYRPGLKTVTTVLNVKRFLEKLNNLEANRNPTMLSTTGEE